MLNRRALLTGLAASAALATMPEALAAARGRGFFKRIGKPIGLQLYTLGDEVKADVDGVLAKVAKIGFRDLELPQTYGLAPAALKAAADRSGLRFSAIHLADMPNMPAEALSLKSPVQRIVDDLGALGIHDAVLPIMSIPASFKMGPGDTFQSAIARALVEAGPDHWKRTAERLNERAAALKPFGIRMGYHNHNVEFAPTGGTTGWDVLVAETDPGLVFFEVDVGWIAAAGRDPVAFLKAHKGRVRWLHVKDLKASTETNFALKMDPTEVGSGKQDWPKILAAAHAVGVEHFYLEQEAPFTMPRIDSAAKGYAFLAKV
jgi:sugar phosphate isomerase/epimerase